MTHSWWWYCTYLTYHLKATDFLPLHLHSLYSWVLSVIHYAKSISENIAKIVIVNPILWPSFVLFVNTANLLFLFPCFLIQPGSLSLLKVTQNVPNYEPLPHRQSFCQGIGQVHWSPTCTAVFFDSGPKLKLEVSLDPEKCKSLRLKACALFHWSPDLLRTQQVRWV